jgi:hypothetical protein
VKFVPFDPATKICEATTRRNRFRNAQRIVKGAYAVVAGLALAGAERGGCGGGA